MALEPQLAAGEDLGAYRIEKLIARGGMGEVYRALDRRLGRPVALKLLVREIADEDRFGTASCANRGSRRASITRTCCPSTRPASSRTGCS